MALRATCDVFLTAVTGVEAYVIVVISASTDATRTKLRDSEGAAEMIATIEDQGFKVPVVEVRDLCPAAFKRLEAKIVAGTTPPPERKKKDVDVPGQMELTK